MLLIAHVLLTLHQDNYSSLVETANALLTADLPQRALTIVDAITAKEKFDKPNMWLIKAKVQMMLV